MNGYKLTEKMQKTRKWYKLSPHAQLLYYELITVCNEKRWKEVFQCPNTKLCRTLNYSVHTLIKARKELTDCGLIFYQSAWYNRQEGSYSFVKDPGLPATAPDEVATASQTFATVPDKVATTVPDADIIKQEYIYKNKPSQSPRESEHFKDPLLIPFGSIKSSLLADMSWKEQTAMISGLSTVFLAILPTQIDIFLQYLVATGEENTVKTLSDAKRRFFWWWKNHGKKAYEELPTTKQIVVW